MCDLNEMCFFILGFFVGFDFLWVKRDGVKVSSTSEWNDKRASPSYNSIAVFWLFFSGDEDEKRAGKKFPKQHQLSSEAGGTTKRENLKYHTRQIQLFLEVFVFIKNNKEKKQK